MPYSMPINRFAGLREGFVHVCVARVNVRMVVFMSACPATRWKVKGFIHFAQRVKHVWRSTYNSNGDTPLAFRAFMCCFFRLDGSICPLAVSAGKSHPSPLICEILISMIALTRFVTLMCLRDASRRHLFASGNPQQPQLSWFPQRSPCAYWASCAGYRKVSSGSWDLQLARLCNHSTRSRKFPGKTRRVYTEPDGLRSTAYL
jgi:hypothetical protein